MTNKRKLLITVVVAAALGVTHMVYVRSLNAEVTGGAKVDVLIVSRAVSAGTELREADLGVRRIPAAFVDKRFVRVKARKEVVGVPVAVSLQQGDVLMWTDFKDRSDNHVDLAQLIEPGKRAFTMPATATSSFAGMLRPGHRVDVLSTIREGANAGTRVLLQNVPVVAVGRTVDQSGDGAARAFNSITLSVSVEESALLTFARSVGTLTLVLRGNQDLDVVQVPRAQGMDDILGLQRSVPKRKGGTAQRGTEHTIERIPTR